MLSRPSIWCVSRLEKSLFSLLSISEDAAILRVHVSAVVLSTRIRDLGVADITLLMFVSRRALRYMRRRLLHILSN